MTSDAFLLTPEMVSCLPRRFQPVAELIGLEKTSALIREFGGIQLYVGHRKKGRDRRLLVEAIGQEAFAQLVTGYGGTLVNIPQIAGILQRHRHALIQRRFLEGATIEELMVEFALTQGTIYQIVRPIRKHIPRRKPYRPAVDVRMEDYRGESAAEFARKHGVTPATASAILRKHGINRSEVLAKQWAERRNELVQEYRGESIAAFALKMGINHNLAEDVIFLHRTKQPGSQLAARMAYLTREYKGESVNAFAQKMGISRHLARKVALIHQVRQAESTAFEG